MHFKPSVCALVWVPVRQDPNAPKIAMRADEASRTYPLKLIEHIYLGKQTSRLKSKTQHNQRAVEANCFSLVAPHATLDLEAQSPRERAAWVFGIRTILRKVNPGKTVKEHQIPEEDDAKRTTDKDTTNTDDAIFSWYYQQDDEGDANSTKGTPGDTTDPFVTLEDVWETNIEPVKKSVEELQAALANKGKPDVAGDKDKSKASPLKLVANTKLLPSTWEEPKPKTMTFEVPPAQRACSNDCSIM